MRVVIRAAIAAVMMVVAAAGAPAAPAHGPDSQPGYDDPGKAIYEGKGACFTCHARDGRGTPLGPNLTDDEWLNFDGTPDQAGMEQLVRKGVAKPVRHPAPMPPMGGARLSDTELQHVAAYVLRLAGLAEPGRR